jgi:hypothetical protein
MRFRGLLTDAEKQQEARYWMLATRAEAAVGLEAPNAEQLLRETFAAAPHDWMKTSTQKQVDKLRGMIADSPLKHVSAAAPAPAAAGG